MKKIYTAPSITITKIESCDVITTSSNPTNIERKLNGKGVPFGNMHEVDF